MSSIYHSNPVETNLNRTESAYIVGDFWYDSKLLNLARTKLKMGLRGIWFYMPTCLNARNKNLYSVTRGTTKTKSIHEVTSVVVLIVFKSKVVFDTWTFKNTKYRNKNGDRFALQWKKQNKH